jgi:DnaA family protein
VSLSPQIPLQLEPTRTERFADYVAGPNQPVVDEIRALQKQPGRSLFFHGQPSSGKTHLLNALCLESRENGGTAWYIGLEGLEAEAAAGLKGLRGLVCFDGLHAVAGDFQWEEAVFHCFNEVLEDGGQVVAGSRIPLSGLEFALPDLASRMAWGLRLKLEPLSEEDRLRVLQVRAQLLELDLPEDVQRFMLRRISRDLGTLLAALDKLHRGARADKRRVTVPLARQLLASELGGTEASENPGSQVRTEG